MACHTPRHDNCRPAGQHLSVETVEKNARSGGQHLSVETVEKNARSAGQHLSVETVEKNTWRRQLITQFHGKVS